MVDGLQEKSWTATGTCYYLLKHALLFEDIRMLSHD